MLSLASVSLPVWIGSLTDAGIKADMTQAAAGGVLTYGGLLTVLDDLDASLTASGGTLSASQFADLRTIAANCQNGLATSSYVAGALGDIVNGNAANVSYTGGAATATAMGNLLAGSSAAQLNQLIGKWMLGTDLPSSAVSMCGCNFTVGYQFNANPLFAGGGPSMNDVNQGALGDCYLLASLAEVADKNPSFISSMIADNGNGSYGVRFYVNGQADWVTVNDALASSNGSAVFNRAGTGEGIWASLVEKAYAQLAEQGVFDGNPYGGYGNAYSSIGNGGDPASVLGELTDTTVTDVTAANNSATLNQIVSALAAGDDVVLSSYTNSVDGSGKTCLVADHAMSVIGYDSTTGDLIIRNPWGTMAGQTWETTFEVSMAQLSVQDAWGDSDVFAIDSAGTTTAVTTATPGWVAEGKSVAVSGLFSATDPSGRTITEYQIQLSSGGGSIALNGATNLATAAQAAQGTIVVSAADLGLLTYVGGTLAGQQTLTVTAQDGNGWGNAATSVVTTVAPTDAPAVVTGESVTVANGEQAVLSTLFTAVDANGNAITGYRFQLPEGGGSINLNGATNLASAADAAQGIIQVSAADLSKLTYIAGGTAGCSLLNVQAADANGWSGWVSTDITTLVPPPQVIGNSVSMDLGQTVAATSLFTASDPAGNPLIDYEFYVAPGGPVSVELNGASNFLSAYAYEGYYAVTAADLSKVTFVASGTGNEDVEIWAADANGWSQAGIATVWAFDPTATPAVTGLSATVGEKSAISLQTLFSVSDPSGNSITEYQFQLSAGGGSIELNCATNLATAAQAAQGIVIVAAADLSNLFYCGGSTPGTQAISISALDANGWSSAGTATVTTVAPPTVTANSDTVQAGQSVSVSSLFTASDPAGRSMVYYQVYDPSGGGTVQLNGATNLSNDYAAANGYVMVSAADLAKLTYVAGQSSGAETLDVWAYDGVAWSSAALVTVTTVLPSNPPTVTANALTLDEAIPCAITALFTAVDQSGNAITNYQFKASGGGSIALNGATNLATATQAAQGIVIVSAADLGRLTYLPGGTAGTQSLTIAAEDANGWSATATTTVTVVPPPTVIAQPDRLAVKQSVAVTSLFSVSDPSGKPVVDYLIYASGGKGAINLNGATNLLTSGTSGGVMVSAADLAKLTFAAGAATGVETLRISAYDGSAWSNSASVTVTCVTPSRPVLRKQTAAQTWTQGSTVNFALPAGTFSDPQNESLTYKACLSTGQALPAWLTFNAATQTFTGTVPAGIEAFTLKVTATDTSGLATSENILVKVPAAAPTLVQQTAAQTWTEGSKVSFALPSGIFSDPQSQTLRYRATLTNGQALPSWLVFNATTDTFSGTVPAAAQTLGIKITATDSSNLSASETFTVTVAPAAASAAARPLADQFSLSLKDCLGLTGGAAPAPLLQLAQRAEVFLACR